MLPLFADDYTSADTPPSMIPGNFNSQMWPMISHHCNACSYDTPIQYTASVVSEAQYCNHCGARAENFRIRTQQEVAREKTMEMQQSDELAQLFARQMGLNPTPPPERQQEPQMQMGEEPKRIWSSTHYVPPTSFANSTPQASPEPETRPLSDDEIAEMLIRNGVDPHSLFPSQVSLFRGADPDQQLRLLELWRISPPNSGSYDVAKEQASWIESTLQREEEMARVRYERAVLASQGIVSQPQGQEISRPSSAPEARSRPATSHVLAEPYMSSGYEMLAAREYERSAAAQPLVESTRYKQHSDPVYRGWAGDKGMQDMENSYGEFEARRNGDGWGGGGSLNGLDEEMIM